MQTILLLHGAIGAAQQLKPLVMALNSDYEVHTLDFSGHGGRKIAGDPFSIALFANDVIAFMDEQGLEKVHLFGYSMGGYVAMYLARHYPDRVLKLVTLATKFYWDKDVADKETRMLDAEKIVVKLPAFAQVLEARHKPEDWKLVLRHTADMLVDMGNDNPLKPADYPEITAPVLVLIGDRDKMVTLEETVEVFRSLPAGEMGMLPRTPHAIEQVEPAALRDMIGSFLG